MQVRRIVVIVLMCGLGIGVLGACNESQGTQNNKTAVSQREDVFDTAQKVAPVITPVNFPIRKALVEFTVRQDQINHPWYIYLQNYQGEVYGYYVGSTYPISTCNFLSSSERVRNGSGDTELVLQAPSLDGIFYGGSGASAACQSLFFFDVTTNALITFSSPFWFASDSPLDLDAPRINVNTEATPKP